MEANITKQNIAISIVCLKKVYRLYQNTFDRVIDALGLDRLRIGRKKKYQEFSALDDLSVTIEHGERIGLIGRNGAGKTTLLKLITGVFEPTAGKISVDGSVQALMQIGIGFHMEMSGYENIRGALIYNGLTERQMDEAIEDVIEFVELGDYLYQPLRTYSLGMLSRLQFATATAIRPDILIADEVLGVGDAYFSAKSADRMRRLTGSGCTLILVSHSMQQILQFCERAIWIDC